jgi:putative aminopeptidase FrvX
MDKKFLKKYIKTPSPVGYEVAFGGQKVWTDYIEKVCPNSKISLDNYGSAIVDYRDKKGKRPYKKTLVLDAHVDEIAFRITDITSGGYLRIGTLGGSDISIAPSARVNIWRFTNPDKPVRGVFGHPAIHVHKRDFKADLDRTFVDIGASNKDEVLKKGIEIGNPITMDGELETFGNYLCGRALDDKIGGYITSQILKRLYKNNVDLKYNLVVVNAVQEEVGLYGAKMAAINIQPDMAIAIDVCHCTDSPAYSILKHGSTTSGKGPVIMTGPSLHNTLTEHIIECSKKSSIDIQRTSSGGSSGTNADSYAYGAGAPTSLLKLALKYMHTTVEMVDKYDVEQTIEVLYKSLTSPNLLKLDLVGNKLSSNL